MLPQWRTGLQKASPSSNGSSPGYIYPIDPRAFFSDFTVEQLSSTIHSGIVVAENKSCYLVLEDNVPPLVLRMHGYAKALGLVSSLSICAPK